MRSTISFFVLITIFIIGISNLSYSQAEDLYDSGTVWSCTFIRTGANATDDYLKGLKNTWDATMKEAVKAGFVKSYKILLGNAANHEDFNLILMIENENMASLDPNPTRKAKMDEIQKKISENMKGEFDKTVSNYENIRELLGTKLMREIKLK
ncbi:MAG: hypothetical protein ABI638_10305 [Ignavibacteriota bacterium]